MHDVATDLVILDLANHSALIFIVAIFLEHEDGVPSSGREGSLKRARCDLEGMWLLLMTVDDTGEHALLTAKSPYRSLASL